MMQYMMSRMNYYTGMKFAKNIYDKGGRPGMVIAIIIVSVNLVIFFGCCIALFVCIRYRACYFCMKELSPGCTECLVECGCGPPDAEALNNEVVMKDVEMSNVKVTE